METSTVAMLVKNFNIVSVVILAFLAACGIIVIIGGKSWRGIFRHKSFLRAFCVASLVAFAVEATVFNFQYYLKWFAGTELHTKGAPPSDNPNVILTSDGNFAEITNENQNSIGIKFKNVNRKVTSIFVDVAFDYSAVPTMAVQWTDEEGTPRTFTKRLYKGLPHENYTVLQPRGKVTELKVVFSGSGPGMTISQVALNRQIPFYFSGLRLLAVSFFLFVVLSLLNKNLRAKISYCLFKYKFDPANKIQNLIYAFSVVLLILFSWVCVYTSLPKSAVSTPPHQMYNRYLVDALIAGKTYLDYGNPEKILEWERPYDHHWRTTNHNVNVDWIWEWCYYKGKYYSHYGVVPAVILYVPYKLITGNYLSNHGGIFIFSAIAVVLLAMFWRFCVKKYMPDSKFAFYMLSFLTLFFASGLYGIFIFTRFYTIVQAAAFMFTVAGVLLLFKSVENENVNRLKLFFACLCFALIAGCRPNMVFISLLVPVVLWKHKSWKLFLFVIIPYIIVAIPLCYYNYVRFGSISDFGRLYTLTDINHPSLVLLNPIGRIMMTITYSLNYLFLPNKYSLYFPFVECFPRPDNNVTQGIFLYQESCAGIINFPIVFTLFYLFKNIFDKNRLKTFYLLLTFLIVAAVTIIGISSVVQSSVRYIADFALFIILPSLFCAYYWSNVSQNELLYKARMKVIYVLLTVSVFVGLCLFVTGGLNYMEFRNPTLYRYLEYSLGFIRNV